MKKLITLFSISIFFIVSCSTSVEENRDVSTPLENGGLKEEPGEKEEEVSGENVISEDYFLENGTEKIEWLKSHLPLLTPPLYFEFEGLQIADLKAKDSSRYFNKPYKNILNYDLYELHVIELFILGQMKSPEGNDLLVVYAEATDTVEHIEDYKEIFFQPINKTGTQGKAEEIISDTQYESEDAFLNNDFQLMKDYASESECAYHRFNAYNWIDGKFELMDALEIMTCPPYSGEYLSFEQYSDSIETTAAMLVEEGKWLSKSQIENINLENYVFKDSLKSAKFVYPLKD